MRVLRVLGVLRAWQRAGVWTRVFAADPEIIRKTITLNGQSVAVVGVAPEGFDGIDMQKIGPVLADQHFSI